MKYFVYVSDCDSETFDDEICILSDSGLENAIAFASYVFVNSRQNVRVKTENDIIVVDYKVV